MKTWLILLTFCALAGSLSVVQAQTDTLEVDNRRNLVKLNALTLVAGKFSVEYERLLTNRIAAGAAISIRPNGSIPFRSTVKNIVDDEDINILIDDLRSSSFSITPEVRFYMAKRGAFRGFYLAPYFKYASYGTSLPYDFEVVVAQDGAILYSRDETIPLSGNVRSFTGGVSFGANFKLSRDFYLDWRVLGPGYGLARGNISGRMALSPLEQDELRHSLEELKRDLADLPLTIEIEHEVHENGADIRVQRSPWAAIRSGLSLSYRF